MQNLTYQWDKVGNLTQRKDNNLNLMEDFYYDNLYRLDYSRLNGAPTPNLDMTYDSTGNITVKAEGVSSSSYNYSTAQSGCTYYTHAQPHAVRKVGTTIYCYDANGNMVKRGGNDITWYSYNLPNRINQGSNYAQFSYGADRGRYKQVAFTAAGGSLPSGTETTIYVRGLFEKVTKPSGVIEYKHYILAGNDPIAIRTLRSNSADDTRYLHKDHLGSVDAITNESGSVVLRLSYDAFGKRRNATSWSGALATGDWTSIAALTHRGFTFHEALDNVDLVHMNGRVYDPNIARFISADPLVKAPFMSQGLNRYSYVMNNPLSFTDPSGFSWFSKAWNKVTHVINKYWREIVAIIVAYYTGYYAYGAAGGGGFGAAVAGGAVGGAAYGATRTALYGGTPGQILQAALIGGITGGLAAGMTYGLGQLFSPVTSGTGAATQVDFGWSSLNSGAKDTDGKAAATTGISPEVIAGIGAAKSTNNETSAADFLSTYHKNLQALSLSEKRTILWASVDFEDYIGGLTTQQLRDHFPYMLTHQSKGDVDIALISMLESLNDLQVALFPEGAAAEIMDIAKTARMPFRVARAIGKARDAFNLTRKELTKELTRELGNPRHARELYESTFENEVRFECGNVVTGSFACYVVLPLYERVK